MTEYRLPELAYGYDALEPYLSPRILELHHGKHHKAYVDGANTVLEKLEHARATDEYEIGVEVTDARCVIDVVHAGAVVDPVRLAPPTDPVLLEESGRGLQIIRALADELYLTPARQGGVILRAIATLHWQPSKPAWDANT